jgi:hypothetical protein
VITHGIAYATKSDTSPFQPPSAQIEILDFSPNRDIIDLKPGSIYQPSFWLSPNNRLQAVDRGQQNQVPWNIVQQYVASTVALIGKVLRQPAIRRYPPARPRRGQVHTEHPEGHYDHQELCRTEHDSAKCGQLQWWTSCYCDLGADCGSGQRRASTSSASPQRFLTRPAIWIR